MVYQLKMVFFHGELLNNQMVIMAMLNNQMVIIDTPWFFLATSHLNLAFFEFLLAVLLYESATHPKDIIITKPAQVQNGFRSFWTYTHQKGSRRNSHIQNVRWFFILHCLFFVYFWLSTQGALLPHHLRMFPICSSPMLLGRLFLQFPHVGFDMFWWSYYMFHIRFLQHLISDLVLPWPIQHHST